MRMLFPSKNFHSQKFCASDQFIVSDQPDEESNRCTTKHQFVITALYTLLKGAVKNVFFDKNNFFRITVKSATT